jgi:DNA polymerase V
MPTSLSFQALMEIPQGFFVAPYQPAPGQPLPFFEGRIPAGFPSPAQDYLEDRLDLNELVIRHPAATFFVQVQGQSMVGAGIHSGDTLVVDRAETPRDKSVVVAVLDGAFTVKRLRLRQGRAFLVAEDGAGTRTEITAGMDFEVWGVVTYVIHRVK